MTLTETLTRLPGRCSCCGYDVERQGCKCGGTEWQTFVAALRTAARDGLVHQSAMRPLIRGRVQPKHIGTYYRRAKAEGLLVDTGEREPSDDVAGRNADKLDRIYRLSG